MSTFCSPSYFLTKKAITVGKVFFKGEGNSQRVCSLSLLSITEVCLGQFRH